MLEIHVGCVYIKLGGGCGNKAGRLLPDRRDCCHLVCWRLAWYISCKQLHLDSLSFCSRRRSSYVLPVTKETIKYFISAQSKINSCIRTISNLYSLVNYQLWSWSDMLFQITYFTFEITSIKQAKENSKHREKIVYNNPCFFFI